MNRYYGLPVEGAHLVLAFASIAGLHRKAFDAQLLLQQFPPPHAIASLIAAAQALGFDTRFCPSKLERLNRAGLQRQVQVIAHLTQGMHPVAEAHNAFGQERIEVSPVRLYKKHILPGIAAQNHAVQTTGQVQARFAGHTPILPGRGNHATYQA